jgi:glutamate-5-semialdehyde dehydrogenase
MKSTQSILTDAKKHTASLAVTDTQTRNKFLYAMADAITAHTDDILSANNADMEKAQGHISDVMLDRLKLDEKRIHNMANGITDVASLPDSVGKILSETMHQNGMRIVKTTVPLGVIAIIYESRPNVTSDAAALCIKSANTCILRSGKEAWNSANAVVSAMQEGLKNAGGNPLWIQLVEDTTRSSSLDLMRAVGYVDLLIPRGGKGLIKSCVENAIVPCIETGTGICHIYVDKDADFNMALSIIENAKTSRPSVCNAAEVCLVDEKIACEFLPMLVKKLRTDRISNGKIPVELRCDESALKFIADDASSVGEDDFDTEFLDYILAVKTVNGVDEAIAHIKEHSTHHSEAIITSNEAAAIKFMNNVDSAAVYWNASTRFTDGGEFGLGCEMGISTQKLHARGPMGLDALCTYQYRIYGSGQVR